MQWAEIETIVNQYQCGNNEPVAPYPQSITQEQIQVLKQAEIDSTLRDLHVFEALVAIKTDVFKEGQVIPEEIGIQYEHGPGKDRSLHLNNYVTLSSEPYRKVRTDYIEYGKPRLSLQDCSSNISVHLNPMDYEAPGLMISVETNSIYDFRDASLDLHTDLANNSLTDTLRQLNPYNNQQPQPIYINPNEAFPQEKFYKSLVTTVRNMEKYNALPLQIRAYYQRILDQLPENFRDKSTVEYPELLQWAYEVKQTPGWYQWLHQHSKGLLPV